MPSNGIFIRDGKYYITCGENVHEIRTQGRIKISQARHPVIAPEKRTPKEKVNEQSN